MARPGSSVIYPEDTLPVVPNTIAGFQHVVAMFGATVLGPLLMGFDPNVAIFFSGVATLVFYAVVRGKVPSYLGSSFAFIGAVIAATAYSGSGLNPNISVALGGIIAAGAAYFFIGFIVYLVGYEWIESVMPPVVTGTIVAIIGLNLAPVAVKQISGDSFSEIMGFVTIFGVAAAAVYLRGFASRLPVLIGGVFAYVVYFLLCNYGHYGKPVDFSGVISAAWFGWPSFTQPHFTWRAAGLIAPVAIILVAENLGHIKAIGAMMERNLDPYIGRAFMGDGLATMISGSCGGTGVTTYAENMGVMAITRNYSGRTFIAAALFAILFGLSPKFGAAILTIPSPVIGGLSFVVFGLITATACRIWVENKVDFSKPRNLIVVGVAVVTGAGGLDATIGGFSLGGIGTATLLTLVLYHLLNLRRS